jgi:hypothetical protein
MKLKLEKADQSSSSEDESDHNMSDGESNQAPNNNNLKQEAGQGDERNDEVLKPVDILDSNQVMASDSETNHAIKSEFSQYFCEIFR